MRNQSLPTRIISGFLALVFYGFTIAPIAGQPAQPLQPPNITNPAFQSQDLDPVDALAAQNPTQAGYEQTMLAGLNDRRDAWNLAAELQIQNHENNTTGWSDYFHNNPEYVDYMRKSAELQTQVNREFWNLLAASRIEDGREINVGRLGDRNLRNTDDLMREAMRRAGATGNRPALTLEEWRWEQQHNGLVTDGLYQYQTALAALQQDRDTFMNELDRTEATFQQNLNQINDYETQVRDGIQAATTVLGQDLLNNDLFYVDSYSSTNAMSVDRNQLNAAGLELQSFLQNMNQALQQGAPLSVLTRSLADYLGRQVQRATQNRDTWASRIRGTTSYPLSRGLADNGQVTTRPMAKYGKYRIVDVLAFNMGDHYGALNWGAINGDPLLNAVVQNQVNGNRSAFDSYIASAGEFRTIEGVNELKACGDNWGPTHWNKYGLGGMCTDGQIRPDSPQNPVNANGEVWGHWGNAKVEWYWAFMYVEPNICCSKIVTAGVGDASIKNQTSMTVHLSYNWYDPNAEANRDTWQSYIDGLSPLLAHWQDDLLPAIEKWEAQTAQYRADHAAWKTQADANRAQMEQQFQAGSARIVQDRNEWMSQVKELERKGIRNFGALKVSIPDVELEAENDRDFLDRGNQGVPDYSLLSGATDSITRGLRAALNLGQAGAMEYQSENRRRQTLLAMADKIEAHKNPLGAEEAEQGIGQLYVQVTDNGVVASRYVHTGVAKKVEGAKGTGAADYYAEYEEETLSFDAPAAIKLARIDDLFTADDKAAEFKNSVADYGKAHDAALGLLDAQLEGADATAKARKELFESDRARQIQEAKDYEAAHKKPFGGALEQIMMSMVGGGGTVSLDQAVTSTMQSQATAKIAKDYGLEALQGFIGGVVGGASAGQAWASATDSVINSYIADKTGIPLTIVAGRRSGQTIEEASGAYLEELVYEKLEEATNITGLSAFLRGQKAAKQAEKDKQKQMEATVVTVAAVAAGPVTGGASLYALAAYKAYEAGRTTGDVRSAAVAGAAGLVTAYTAGAVNMDATWDPKNGFQGGVGFGVGGVANVGLEYSKDGGFGGNVGVTLGEVATVGVSYNATEGIGANVSLSGLADTDLEGFALNLKYTEHGGASGSLGFTGENGIGGTVSYNAAEGWGADISASHKFGGGEKLTGSIGYAEKTGLKANVQTSGWGQTEGNDTGMPRMSGTEGFNDNFNGFGGGLGWTASNGFTANIDVSGTNALNWNEEEGWSGNEDYESSYYERERTEHIQELQKKARKKAAEDLARENEKIREKLAEVTGQDTSKMTPQELHDLADKTPGALKALAEAGYEFAVGGSRDSESWWDRNIGAMYDNAVNSLGGASNDLVKKENGKFKVRTCFVAGTMVLTNRGPIPIEKIQAGMWVLSFNEATEKIGWNRVRQTFVRTTEAVHWLELDSGNTLGTTWSHRFFMAKSRFGDRREYWEQTENILLGDAIHTAGSLAGVGQQNKAIQRLTSGEMQSAGSAFAKNSPYSTAPALVTGHEVENRRETVYNFEVEEAHTYFVQVNGRWLLTHNNRYAEFSDTVAMPQLNEAEQINDQISKMQTSGRRTGRVTENMKKYPFPWVGEMDEKYGPENTKKFLEAYFSTKDAVEDIQDTLEWRETIGVAQAYFLYDELLGDGYDETTQKLKEKRKKIIENALRRGGPEDPFAVAGALKALDDSGAASEARVVVIQAGAAATTTTVAAGAAVKNSAAKVAQNAAKSTAGAASKGKTSLKPTSKKPAAPAEKPQGPKETTGKIKGKKADGYTRKTGETEHTARGRQMHKDWNPGKGYQKEFQLPSGKKVDAINFQKKHIKELKPNTPKQIREGQKQVEGYIKEAEKAYGGRWSGSVETYDVK